MSSSIIFRTKLCRMLLFLMLLPVFLCSVTGCEKKAPDVDGGNYSVSYVPSFSKIQVSTGNEDIIDYVDHVFLDKFLVNDKMYAISRLYTREGGFQDRLEVFDLTTGEQRGSQALGASAAYFEVTGGFIGFRDKRLLVYDEDFQPVKEINLQGLYSRLKEEGSQLSCDDIAVDDEGRIGIISGEAIVFIDGEGNLLRSIERPSQLTSFNRLAVTRSGEWYVLCGNANYDLAIYHIDPAQDKLGEMLANVADVGNYNVFAVGQAGEEGFYIVTNNYIYQYDVPSSVCTGLFCLRDYGVTMDKYTAFGVTKEGAFYIAYETGSCIDEGEDDKQVIELELAVVTGAPENEVKQRTELVMAAFYEPTLKHRESLMEFNRYNPDYYVTVKMYYDREQYDTAKQDFYNDLITGKGADIFWVYDYDIDLENLGEKGAVTDLYELMDDDPDLGREDFIPNILTSMEYDGRLYGVSPAFLLDTLVGKSSVLDEYDQWDISALYDLMKKYPAACLISPVIRENAMKTLVGYSMDSFYDVETGECYFDSPEFVKLLEIVSTLPTGYDFSTPMQELIQKDRVLLYNGIVADCISVKWIDLYFREEGAEYIGYPGTESEAVIQFDYFMAISAQSDNKQGAWEFIKSYFTEDYQKNAYYFPVLQKYFDELLEEEMKECGYSSAMDIYGTSVKGEPLTEGQARTLRDLVHSAKKTAQYDTEIYNIILEEAQSYFAGQKSAEEAAGIIQDRVEIYVGESR